MGSKYHNILILIYIKKDTKMRQIGLEYIFREQLSCFLIYIVPCKAAQKIVTKYKRKPLTIERFLIGSSELKRRYKYEIQYAFNRTKIDEALWADNADGRR
jgi:hypothetical protein